MTFYDIFTYLCTFTIIIPLAVFCLFPVIDHLKTPIRHLLIKISLVFVCYFVLLIIPYMIFQQDLGNILVFLAVPVFFYLFQKETNLMLPASLFVMLTACCLGSLSYVIYHTFGVIFHPHGQSTEFYPESMIAQLIFLVFADIILYKPAKISRLDGYEFPQCLCLADCVYFPMLFYFSRFYLYSTQLL